MTTHTQEVVFSTSAAAPIKRTKTTLDSASHRLIDAPRLVAAIRRTFFGLRDAERPARKSKPERHGYLERSLVAREMYRL